MRAGSSQAIVAETGRRGHSRAALQSQVGDLEDTLSKVSYDPTGHNGKPTVRIDGANLQIVDGSGDTPGTTNGLGNVFIGYGFRSTDDVQTGSHNLVLGSSQTFTSYGGLLVGTNNSATSDNVALFGFGNAARAAYSSVTGGRSNTASAFFSSVSGGQSNTASGTASSILGGSGHTVAGTNGTSP
jgi:hypothetical protein